VVGDFNYFNKLKFYSVKWKSVHVLVIIVNNDNMHGEKLKKRYVVFRSSAEWMVIILHEAGVKYVLWVLGIPVYVSK